MLIILFINPLTRGRRAVSEQLCPASITFGDFFCVHFNFGIVFLTAFFTLIDMLHGESPCALPNAIERQAEQ
jgi:hypothetical protein